MKCPGGEKTIFEEMGGTYVRQGDYFIPCLTLPAEKENKPIDVYKRQEDSLSACSFQAQSIFESSAASLPLALLTFRQTSPSASLTVRP